MTSTRGKWLQSSLTALVILVAPAGTSIVWAQGGYGVDPFRPYNSQYDQYTYPMASTDIAPGGIPRMGNRGANAWQGYLDELAGSGRQGTERYGIGMPYFRSSVDPAFDPKGNREYRPNFKANQTYEQSQELITRKYLAYFAERDPKKRAELLRDFNRARSNASRALSARREDSTRALEAATADTVAQRRLPSPDRRADALPATADVRPRSSSRRSTRALPGDSASRDGMDSIPPPPPVLPGEYSRGTNRRRRPSEILDRSHRLNSGGEIQPNSGGRTGADSRTDRRPVPAAPSPE